jgi:hypothetical protein
MENGSPSIASLYGANRKVQGHGNDFQISMVDPQALQTPTYFLILNNDNNNL